MGAFAMLCLPLWWSKGGLNGCQPHMAPTPQGRQHHTSQLSFLPPVVDPAPSPLTSLKTVFKAGEGESSFINSTSETDSGDSESKIWEERQMLRISEAS